MVWMLPNLTCLTNIYARINLSRPGGLGGITLVHDEQLQYGRILADTKALMEDLARQGNAPSALFADYDLSGAADLRFVASTSDIRLQAADLLAGCAMRFARDAMARPRKLRPKLRDAFFALLGLTAAAQGGGIQEIGRAECRERAGHAGLIMGGS